MSTAYNIYTVSKGRVNGQISNESADVQKPEVLSFSRTVSQLIMRVHKPKVEYKLVHLYSKNPREHLDVLVYKQF